MREALLLDYNGTLSDDELLLAQIYAEMIDGLTVDLYFTRYLGWTDEEIFRDALGRDDVDAFVTGRVDRYCELAAVRPTITPAARDAVSWALERIPVVVVTSAFRREVQPSLASVGLDGVRLVTIEDVVHPKPDPEPYLRACELAGIASESAVAVEDSATGVRSARAAGIECLQLGVDIAALTRETVEELIAR